MVSTSRFSESAFAQMLEDCWVECKSWSLSNHFVLNKTERENFNLAPLLPSRTVNVPTHGTSSGCFSMFNNSRTWRPVVVGPPYSKGHYFLLVFRRQTSAPFPPHHHLAKCQFVRVCRHPPQQQFSSVGTMSEGTGSTPFISVR